MRFAPAVLVATFAVLGPLQIAFSQQPMSKGTWTFKKGKPETVDFDYGTELTAEDIRRLTAFDSITHLYFGYAGVDSEYVTLECELINLGRLKNLEVVYLNKDGIGDDDLRFITLFPNIHEIEFNAKNGEGGCTDRCADHLKSANGLRELRVYNGQFTDEFIDTITKATPNLQELMLDSPEFTDESLRLLAERCKKLKSLSITSDNFTAEGVKHLDSLKHLKKRSVSSPALFKMRQELEE